MKKYIYYLMAFAALAVVSCQPEKKQAEEEEIEGSVEFSVNPTCVVPAEGAEAVELSVISNVPFEPIIEEGADWLRLVEDGKAETAASSFTISVDPQPEADSPSRSAVITFKNTESLEVISTKMSVLTVIQTDAKGLSISITQPGVVSFEGAFLDDDDALEVKYKSNIPIAPYFPPLKEGASEKETAEYEAAYGWIEWDEEESSYDAAKGEGVFVFEIDSNDTSKERSTTLGIIRLDKEFAKEEDAIVEGKSIVISQEAKIGQMILSIEDGAVLSALDILPPAGGDASFDYYATCPVEPYFAEGGELEYEIIAGAPLNTIKFKVPANSSEEAVAYLIYFKDASEPEKEEGDEPKSARAKKEVVLLRDIYTGELISANILVQAGLIGFELAEKDPFDLEFGNSIALTPVFNPEGAGDGRVIEWSSSDPEVLSVEDGMVTAVGVGAATITAEVEDFSASVEITVPWAVALDQDELELIVGKSATLVASFLPEELADVKTIEWSSSDESVATVVDGVVTAVAEGDAVIYATSGDKSAKCEVSVFQYIALYANDLNDSLEGWLIFDEDDDGNTWGWYYLTNQIADPVLKSFSWSDAALIPDNWALSPAVELMEDSNYLTLDIIDSGYNDYMAIYVADAEAVEANETDPLSEFKDVLIDQAFDGWDTYTFPIPEKFNGKSVMFAFRHYNCTDLYWIAINDILVSYGNPYPDVAPAPAKRNISFASSREARVIESVIAK